MFSPVIQQFWVFRLRHSALVYEAESFEPPFDGLLITGCMGWSMSLLNFVVCVNTLAFLLFSVVCDPVTVSSSIIGMVHMACVAILMAWFWILAILLVF